MTPPQDRPGTTLGYEAVGSFSAYPEAERAAEEIAARRHEVEPAHEPVFRASRYEAILDHGRAHVREGIGRPPRPQERVLDLRDRAHGRRGRR
ncbi:MAG: hypothetical protein ACRDYF_04375 [Acidimicrobiia bacterium]